MSASADVLDSQSGSGQILNQEVEKILKSSTFRSSEVLRNLLSFLAACAFERPAESIKVKKLATVVFGRSDNFDSQSDSVVRVHMGRLKSKLAEYYVDEAADHDVVVSTPKVSYTLFWHRRHQTASVPDTAAEAGAAAHPLSPSTRLPPGIRGTRYAILTFVLVTAAVGVAFWAGSSHDSGYAGQQNTPARKTFWHGFAAGKETSLVVFSNLKLVGSLRTGMHVYRGDPADREKPVIESWSTSRPGDGRV